MSPKRHLVWGILGCLLIALLLYGVWYVTRLPSFTIQSVTVEGGETVEHDTIREAVENVLQGDYFKLIPYRFAPFYPYERVREAIDAIDRVNTIDITEDGTNLHVAFTEYRPHALWCTSGEESACFFLDATGYAFAPSPELKGRTLIRHTMEGETELLEKQAMPEDQYVRMNAFLETLMQDLDFRITDVLYTKEGDITLGINGGGKILMRQTASYDDTLNNIKTVLSSDSFRHLKPGNFQYIDVRFGKKIFVNEEPETVASSTASSTETE